MAEHALGLGHAGFGQRDGLVLFVDEVVAGLLELFAVLGLDVALRDGARRQLRDDAIDLVVEIGRFLGRTGNDQRRPRFVDEDAVDFVDDGVVVASLHVLREVELHVVAEVVEAELVVRAVGDVAGVGDLPFLVVQVVLDDADRHPEEAVDAAHPFGVAAGEVVVDRDDVNALAFERVQIRRQRRDERLAFAGLHLGDLAAVQHDAADELHIEVPHVQDAAASLADDREGLGQQVLDRLALGQALAELDGLAAELFVREPLGLGFFRIDLGDERPDAFQLAVVRGADDFREEGIDNHAGEAPRLVLGSFSRVLRAPEHSGYQPIVRDAAHWGQLWAVSCPMLRRPCTPARRQADCGVHLGRIAAGLSLTSCGSGGDG